ncbi:MAG: Hpt domain-containing protein [Acidobacteriota bacterium]|nr:Hpt domain-containing protein [Acidobacteriota bacterium]MDQ7087247.1 Hpt domain-containing protein [Acidobacteriota bacterium]
MAAQNGTHGDGTAFPADLFGRLVPALVGWDREGEDRLAKVAWELDDLLDGNPDSVAKLLPASRLLPQGIDALRSAGDEDSSSLLGALIVLAKALYLTALNPERDSAGLEEAEARVTACLETGAAPRQPAPGEPPASPPEAERKPDLLRSEQEDPAPAVVDPTSAPPEPAGNFTLLPDEPDLELLAEFITENNEWIEMAEGALLALESDPDDDEAVNTVFRAFHAIKGTSAFLGVEAMSVLAHRAETLLSRVRGKEISYGKPEANLSLRSIDVLKDLMAGLEAALAGGRPERPPDSLPLMPGLVAAGSAETQAAASSPAPSPVPRDEKPAAPSPETRQEPETPPPLPRRVSRRPPRRNPPPHPNGPPPAPPSNRRCASTPAAWISWSTWWANW